MVRPRLRRGRDATATGTVAIGLVVEELRRGTACRLTPVSVKYPEQPEEPPTATTKGYPYTSVLLPTGLCGLCEDRGLLRVECALP